jgi:hypothetical protein
VLNELSAVLSRVVALTSLRIERAELAIEEKREQRAR